MHIAIIGGGLTGLSAAFDLLKKGHQVTIFEKESYTGGLASGFHNPEWAWPLERTYHHFFTNDSDLLSLTHELGLDASIRIFSPITSVYYQNHAYPFDTPGNLLSFPGLPLFDKLRTGAFAAFCKINPFWRPLEHITAKNFAKSFCGPNAYETIWKPLLVAKFGPYTDAVAASWLWARIHKRTTALGYFRGGFTTLISHLAVAIEKNGGVIRLHTMIQSIEKTANKFSIHMDNKMEIFDAILVTTPSAIATRLMSLPKAYEKKLLSIPHLWAQALILETNKPILEKIYWLNMTDSSFPFVAVVGHTNMIDKKYYGGHHITYVANYLPDGHPYLSMTKQEIIKTFLPYLKRINPNFSLNLSLVTSYLFTAPMAQPVHGREYSTKAPTIQTPIPGIYLANLDSIYPWDRGTNYAVKLGRQAANEIIMLAR